MLKDKVVAVLSTADHPMTAAEICDTLYTDIPYWERNNKVRYVYQALAKLHKWGNVEKEKTGYKDVRWRLAR